MHYKFHSLLILSVFWCFYLLICIHYFFWYYLFINDKSLFLTSWHLSNTTLDISWTPCNFVGKLETKVDSNPVLACAGRCVGGAGWHGAGEATVREWSCCLGQAVLQPSVRHRLLNNDQCRDSVKWNKYFCKINIYMLNVFWINIFQGIYFYINRYIYWHNGGWCWCM